MVADIQDDLGLVLCEDLKSEEVISYVHCDVTKESDVQNAIDMAISMYGKLDIMFSNAGIPGTNLMEQFMEQTQTMTTSKWFLMLMFLAHFCVPNMQQGL